MHMADYQHRTGVVCRLILLQLFWLLLIFVAARYAMFKAFVDPEQLQNLQGDLKQLWAIGLRYDARVCAIALMPVLAFGLLLSPWKTSWNVLEKATPVYLGLASFTLAAFAIGNYYYYETYHNFIDIFIFGFFAEGPLAVAGNFWEDYPAIRIFAALVALAILPALAARRYFERCRRLPKKRRAVPLFICALLIFASVLFVLARGSVGTFPFGRDANQFSRLAVLNKLAPNGIIAFDWAIKDHRKDVSFAPVTPEEGQRLVELAGLPSIKGITPANPWLAEHKPHVVAVILESFGSNMLVFDKLPENDLLGSLRQHFNEDFLFPRFLPEGNGTAPSFSAMFFLSPVQNISHSSAQKVPLSYTPFQVYKQAGYRTVFIHPGNMMWRNFANYLPLQGVDETYDQNDMMREYPESAAEITAWGVPDGYAYRLAEKLLKEAEEPLFIGILTGSNHPPYEVPAHYRQEPVSLTPDLQEHTVDGGIEQLNILGAFQYASDAFGQFISAVKGSELGAKTLIAGTGDHQMRRLNSKEPEEYVLSRAVPFYLYVPKDILARTNYCYDRARIGSHKDIMPTLYSHSLSGAEYLTLGGRNLMAQEDDPARAFGYNDQVWIDARGAYFGGSSMCAWAGAEGLLLANRTAPLEDAKLLERIKAYPQLLRWQLNARIFGVPLE